MTLPNENSELKTCKCTSTNCTNCTCGCGSDCSCMKKMDTAAIPSETGECPFMKAHPNWRLCPFMSSMFSCKSSSAASCDKEGKTSDHSTCDATKCSDLPMTNCTSCHHTLNLNHTVTLNMDTDVAADQTEETAL